ncbi:MAG: hypothetical protein JNM88_01285 [Chitinophagaceae bacterium]|nr:hypothetical protein [Chitinophagaceae bacterium]
MPKFYYVKSSFHPKALLLSITILLCPLFFYGQTLTGLWTGALQNDSTTIRKDQLFEIALTEYNGKVYGYSRSEFIVDDTLYYIVKRVKGTIEGDICEVTDDEIVSYNFRGRLDKKVKVTSTFRRNQQDSTWHLDGTWKTNANRKYYSVSGKVNLSEEKELAYSKLFPHLEELNLANDVAFYKENIAAPAVVRVARPAQSYDPRPEIGEQPTAAPSVAVNKIPAAASELKQPEEIITTPVKRTDEALVKTETNTIPDQNSSPAVQKPAVSAKVTDKRIATSMVKKQEAPSSSPPYAPEEVQSTATASKEPPSTASASDNNTVAINKPAVSKTSKPATPQTKSVAQPAANAIATTSPVKTVVTKITPASSAASVPVNNTAKPIAATTQQPADDAAVKNTLVKTQTAPAAVVAAPESGTVKRSEINKNPVTDITAKAAVIAGRKSEFSQVVNFKADSLVISLYDNGEIDGDTVSVFMNGEAILSKQGLKSSAIKKTIYITQGQEEDFTLVMFAESLGKYPPNTGLLVIRDGDDVYNLRFSSDFEKNAGIVFRRKK